MGGVVKIYGPPNVPEFLDDKMVEKFYRYDSGGKTFKELAAKAFSLTTDAVVLTKAYNNKKMPTNILY